MSQTSQPNAFVSFFAGGLAGMASWVVCYPMDVIKTIIQVDGMNAKPIYKSSFECALVNYQKYGLSFFTRGLSTALWRAFPMNAACFMVVSIIMRIAKHPKIHLIVSNDSLPTLTMGPSLIHIHHHEVPDTEQNRKRSLMASSLRTLGTFNEAVCPTETLQMANEFYPDREQREKASYYLYEDDRILENIELSALYKEPKMDC